MSTSIGCMILMTGLPGTGKSTLARALADRLGGIVLDKDQIRAALFPASLIEYSQRQDDFCMRILLETAEYLLRHAALPYLFVDGRPCVLRSQVDEVAQTAAQLHCQFAILHTVCSEETARCRLEQSHVAKNRDFRLYSALSEKMERLQRPHLQVNTDVPLDLCVQHCLAYIAGTIAGSSSAG